MNAKQYLEQTWKLLDSLTAKRDEWEFLETVSTASGAINYENDRTVGSAPSSARFENVTVKKADLENDIKRERQELLEKHAEIRKVILAVEDMDVQNALAEYYLCHKTEDVIASKFHVSKKTIQRRLERGYTEVSKLTGYPVPRMPARPRHPIARQMMKEVYGDADTKM